MCFVSLPFHIACIVYVCTHQLFLPSCECLIGRHDRTAIIGCSPCCVEETIFQEVVSGREAQRILLGGGGGGELPDVADVVRRLSVLRIVPCQICCNQVT